VNKSLRIDLLEALCSDRKSQNCFTQRELDLSQTDLSIIEGIELIISGLQSDRLEPINLTAKFFMDCAYDNEPLVNLIINANDIDEVVNNKTLLMWASNSKYYSLVKTLLKNGVDINKVIQNKSALDYSYNNQDLLTSCLLFVCGCTLSGRSEDTENLIKQIADGNEGPVSQKHWEFLKLFSKVELR